MRLTITMSTFEDDALASTLATCLKKVAEHIEVDGHEYGTVMLPHKEGFTCGEWSIHP